MRLFSAQYGVRVTAHDKRPTDRDFVETHAINEFTSEHNLLSFLGMRIPQWLQELEARPGKRVDEELALATIAARHVMAALEQVVCTGKPFQLHFEDEDDYGTVHARVWVNVEHRANRAHKITKEVLACTPVAEKCAR